MKLSANTLREYTLCLERTGVNRLRKKHRGARLSIPFPNLEASPLSNGPTCFCPVAPKTSLHPDARRFPVGHLHKQGLQLITPGDLPNLKDFGGAKR